MSLYGRSIGLIVAGMLPLMYLNAQTLGKADEASGCCHGCSRSSKS